MTTYLLIIYLVAGGARVIVIPDTDAMSCAMQSFIEMQWNRGIRGIDCVPWQGGEV